jgi:thioesterase domain-containing protein
MQPHGHLPPLFCVHPAGRDVMAYVNLVRRLGADQPVFGIIDPGDDLARPVTRIAAEHVQALREVRPHGPYALAGWSFGGWVAFEMAVQLRAAGETVEWVGLLDTMSPVLAQAWPHDTDADVVIGVAGDFAAQMRRPFSIDRAALDGLGFDALVDRVSAALVAQDAAPPAFQPSSLAEAARTILDRVRSRAGYAPQPFDGTVTLFRASDVPAEYEAFFAERMDDRETLGWRRHAATVEVHAVPGAHVTLGHEPHVRTLAAVMRDSLAAARGGDRSE